MKEEKICETCKHKNKELFEQPCNRCSQKHTNDWWDSFKAEGTWEAK